MAWNTKRETMGERSKDIRISDIIRFQIRLKGLSLSLTRRVFQNPLKGKHKCSIVLEPICSGPDSQMIWIRTQWSGNRHKEWHTVYVNHVRLLRRVIHLGCFDLWYSLLAVKVKRFMGNFCMHQRRPREFNWVYSHQKYALNVYGKGKTWHLV